MRAKRYEYYQHLDDTPSPAKVYRYYWGRRSGKRKVQYWCTCLHNWDSSVSFKTLHNTPRMRLIDKAQAIKLIPSLKNKI